MKISELLTSDISRLVKKAEDLTEDYEVNANFLHELMDILDDDRLESSLERIDSDCIEVSKIQCQLHKL